MSELAIDRVPTQLPDLTYAQRNCSSLTGNCSGLGAVCRRGVPVFAFATTLVQTYLVQSLTGV